MVGLSKILEDVRIVLDHNDVVDSIAGLGEDQLNLDDIIENQVEAAGRILVEMSPRSYIKWSSSTGGESVDGKYYAIPLPADFVRFGAAKMSDWTKAVVTYGFMSDESYAMQQSEFAGIRATCRKPMAFLCESPDGGSEVQLYPCNTGATLQYFTYCKQPKLANDEIDISDTQYQPFIYITAALVAEVLKDTNKNNELIASAKLMLTIPEETSAGDEKTNQ